MNRAATALLCLLLIPLVAGCGQAKHNPDQVKPRSLSEIRDSGKLIVITRNAPTTWYRARDGEPAGPEHDLAAAFADAMGLELEVKQRKTIKAVLDALEQGKGDLAAAGLTRTGERLDRFRFSATYQPVTQQVVCRRDSAQPESAAELVGLDIEVIADSSYVEQLRQLKADKAPDLTWKENDQATTEQLLRKVWQRKIDCTIADSTIVDINRRYYPELITPFNLSREQHLAWALPQSSADLAEAINGWLEKFRDDGRLANLREQYYGFYAVFDYVDTAVFIRRIRQRFPHFDDLFRAAAKKYDLPYSLLAAQGYQESHWNARARSPTGVRGIMMLTRNTAKAMGVKNRLDARQSIFGGARYMARMKKRFDDDVEEPDRTWLALAAYNIGRAHLHDAQTLARERDLDPHSWRGVKQVLPLLADPSYYHDLKYGYARGTEPVRYVQRIREYQNILNKKM